MWVYCETMDLEKMKVTGSVLIFFKDQTIFSTCSQFFSRSQKKFKTLAKGFKRMFKQYKKLWF